MVSFFSSCLFFCYYFFFFFSSRRRHTRWNCDWSSDVCSSDLGQPRAVPHRDPGVPADPHVPWRLPGHGLSVAWLVTAILVSEIELVVMSIAYWLTVGPVITMLRPHTYGTQAMTLVIIVWSRPE